MKFFSFIFCFYEAWSHCSSGCPGIHYVVQAALKCPIILLPQLLKCWELELSHRVGWALIKMGFFLLIMSAS